VLLNRLLGKLVYLARLSNCIIASLYVFEFTNDGNYVVLLVHAIIIYFISRFIGSFADHLEGLVGIGSWTNLPSSSQAFFVLLPPFIFSFWYLTCLDRSL
jgi:hypothetical protein